MAIGTNIYNSDLNSKYKNHYPLTIHAEENACYKLPVNQNKKGKKIDIIVFRTNKKGETLSMAKSCDNCKYHIKTTLYNKNYKLRNFYYTDQEGQIIKDTI